MKHHRPHLHRPCMVDLVAKFAAVNGALDIVRADKRAAKSSEGEGEGDPRGLAEGTLYDYVEVGEPRYREVDDGDATSTTGERRPSTVGSARRRPAAVGLVRLRSTGHQSFRGK